jgi:tetratricopeptide (TPR) repeat protein
VADAGTLVGGRFEIESLAGKGGMGAVYRARDRTTGGIAAVKILHDEAPADHHERLAREARLLSELTHPAFVRYLAFGDERGRPFLAMEWLDGEDLAARLRRDGLGAGDAVRIALRVAAALGAAHARGIVHRDVKPSNLFLVDGDPDRVKLLDFGIARVQAANDAMTRTGAVIGTPRYMAPEQARGSRELDARADVFSLGCVLFECLAGKPPFTGSNSAAVFAKILLEEAPPISSVRDDLPGELEELVARMLAKQPAARPRDGAAVAAELETIGEVGDALHQRSTGERDSGVTAGEQRLVCVVFAAQAMGDPAATPELDASGVRTLADSPTTATDTIAEVSATYTVDAAPPPPGGPLRAVSAVIADHRGRGEVLADGSLVVTLFGQGAATDQAARAARCALAIHAIVPRAAMALAIGRCVPGDRLPLGELIERATSLVRDGARTIRVDEVSAGLLDVRFAIEGDDTGLVLARERDVATAARTLLGKPIPCIGRDRELAALGAIWQECVAEPMAHVVVVTSAAGVGKSRLRYELVQRLHAETWIGRGDPMSAGAPFAMLAQALRRAAGIVDDEPLSVRHRKLKARVGRHVAPAEVARVTEFVGELIGAPTDDVSVQLRAARQDPQLMGDQMLRACEDLFAAECAAHPVLLVLEDLQWGDLPTVHFVDAIVRRLADRPLMVLALARPDVDTVFARLWSERGVERINLGELTRRASEKLVREALGADADAEIVARVVDRAAGNAFYLEELIRSVAEGHGDRLPETVVAMAQARIDGLELEARHVLRAASIFGQVFWRTGVAALLEGGTTQVDDWLDELVRRELITARRDSRFGPEHEYTFRHSLVREAAYAMLTDRDRMVGHRLAGEWLEARVTPEGAGDLEAVALAEHFLRGNEPRRSIAWYRQAAEQALEGNDLANAIERAERAIACVHAVGDTGSDRDNDLVGVLRQLQSGAHAWRGEYALAIERGAEALDRLTPASVPWLVAAAAVADAGTRRLEHAQVIELCHALADAEVAPAAHRAYAHAVAMTMTTLLWHADDALVRRLFARLDRVEAEAAGGDPGALAWIQTARSWRALRDGDHAASLALDQSAEDCFTVVGDLRHACRQHANVGYGELMLGAFDRAERSLREAIAISSQIGLHQVTAQAQHNLGLAVARQGRLDEGRKIELAALDAFEAQGNRRMVAAAHNYLAMIEIAQRDFTEAIAHARSAVDAASDKPGALSIYRGTLANAHRLANHVAAALAEATRAIELVETHGRPEEGEAAVRLAYAEALHASGAVDKARRAIADAAHRLRIAAAKISDPERRRTFLECVVENAATLDRAATWRAELG